MHRVLEHVDRHLDESLDLARLAEVAHFSPFHFHRVFAAWMGERLGDYLRRRRLEVAALRLLAQPGTPVLSIALAVGFGSGEAFTRAFKLRFGCAPSTWRAQQAEQRRQGRNPGQADRNLDQAGSALPFDHGSSFPPHEEIPVNVQVIDRAPVTVAYLRHLGPYGASIERFWGETVYPWLVTHQLLGQPRYGISHDDPSLTDPAQCRYDACAEVPAGFVPAGAALKTTIDGGRYAVLGFKGTSDEIGAAWSALLRDWLPGSGLQLDNRPCFEYYPPGASWDPVSRVFDCEICIPVARA
jgi:AraC family transcriptional regulator